MSPGRILSLMIVFGVSPLAGAASSQAGFYDGKNVTVIVNAGAGGGLTRIAQTFSAFMEKHLGKNTNMVIKNVPGSGGIKGLNLYAEKTKADGLTILWGAKNLTAVLLKKPGVRYDPAQFKMIGWHADTYVTIARTDIGKGLKKPGDLVNVNGIIVGGRAPSSALDLYSNLPLRILGITNYRYVPGYNAQPKMNAAIRSKEINMLTTGHPGYHAFYKNTILKSGEALALYYHAPIDYKTGKPTQIGGRYPADIRNFLDYYREVKGKDPSGPLWELYKWFSTFEGGPMGYITLKDTPADRLAELRRAYGETTKDPGFLAAMKKQLRDLPVHFFVGEEGQFVLTDYKNISVEALKGLKELTAKPKS